MASNQEQRKETARQAAGRHLDIARQGEVGDFERLHFLTSTSDELTRQPAANHVNAQTRAQVVDLCGGSDEDTDEEDDEVRAPPTMRRAPSPAQERQGSLGVPSGVSGGEVEGVGPSRDSIAPRPDPARELPHVSPHISLLQRYGGGSARSSDMPTGNETLTQHVEPAAKSTRAAPPARTPRPLFGGQYRKKHTKDSRSSITEGSPGTARSATVSASSSPRTPPARPPPLFGGQYRNRPSKDSTSSITGGSPEPPRSATISAGKSPKTPRAVPRITSKQVDYSPESQRAATRSIEASRAAAFAPAQGVQLSPAASSPRSPRSATVSAGNSPRTPRVVPRITSKAVDYSPQSQRAATRAIEASRAAAFAPAQEARSSPSLREDISKRRKVSTAITDRNGFPFAAKRTVAMHSNAVIEQAQSPVRSTAVSTDNGSRRSRDQGNRAPTIPAQRAQPSEPSRASRGDAEESVASNSARHNVTRRPQPAPPTTIAEKYRSMAGTAKAGTSHSDNSARAQTAGTGKKRKYFADLTGDDEGRKIVYKEISEDEGRRLSGLPVKDKAHVDLL